MTPLAIPLFLLTTDVAGNVSVVEGINDNAAERIDATGARERHASLFTGLSATGTLRVAARDSDSHALSARTRLQTYNSLSSVPSRAPSGTAIFSYTGAFSTSKRGGLALGASASFTSIASARASDGNLLLTLDPLSNGTQVAFYSGSASYSHALSPRLGISQSLGLLATSTLTAAPIDAANGVVLDRRGIDGIIPSSTTTLSRELGPRDTGLLSVTYRMIYSPYSFDIRTVPAALGPPQRIHQVIPGVGLSHAVTDTITSTTTAGVSFATAPLFDPEKSVDVFPVGSQQLVFAGRRFSARALASVTYGTTSARLGAGPAYSLVGSVSGAPIEGHAYRSLYMVAAIQANHSTVRTADGTAALEGVGTGVEFRYGLTKWLGIYTGYDLRLTSQFGGAGDGSFRQIVFVGLSGYFSSDKTLPPIETTQSPYAP
ncbi:MAG: hypothetical protein IPG50_24605 [Myxococcales bacterium]|nr:hypothetical protein [Myxococcales bacterium]